MISTASPSQVRLESVQLTTGAGASATIFLQGAQVTSWRPLPSQTEHLFLSAQSHYREGVAIRGGVPIIFPQFASRGPLRKHGFARTCEWQLLSNARLDEHRAQAILTLNSNEETRSQWPHNFALTYTITLTDTQLDMQLNVCNTSSAPFDFTAALHTYLRVEDVRATRLYGLQGSRYEAADGAGRRELREVLMFTEAIDRIYHQTASPLLLKSPAQYCEIHSAGFDDTVVWNPWAEACAAMDDMADDDFQKMLCVEAACAINPLVLAGNASWTGRQTLTAIDTTP